MKTLSRLALIALSATILSAAHAQNPRPHVPFQPTQLLAVLPEVPTGWTTRRSDGMTTFSGSYKAEATRTFRETVPTAPGAPASAAPQEVEIRLVDTAGYQPALVSFLEFQPEKSPGLEKRLFGSLPAIISTPEPGVTFGQVLVSARYLVEIKLTNAPKPDFEPWLRLLHFDHLPVLEGQPPALVGNKVALVYVDELNPQKNRQTVVSRNIYRNRRVVQAGEDSDAAQ